jgi:uncharacterized protein Smg (DUF494 family)
MPVISFLYIKSLLLIMVLEKSVFFTPWMIFLFAIFIVGAAIIALTVVEKRLNKKLVQKKQEENSYVNRIRKTLQMEKNPQQSIFVIDEIAREFIAETFQIDPATKYSGLIEEFKKKNNEEAVRFCERMQEALYSGEKLDDKRIEFLSGNLVFLINNEEKKEAEIRKLAKSNRLFGKILEEKEIAKRDFNVGKTSLGQKNQTVDMRLVTYIEEGSKRGFKTNLLKQHLLNGGFEEDDVTKAILHHQSQPKKEEEKVAAAAEPPKPLPVQKPKPIFELPKGLPFFTKVKIFFGIEPEMKTAEPQGIQTKPREDADNQKKVSWFNKLFKKEQKNEPAQPTVNLKILEILSESKKRGYNMEAVINKLAEKGFDKSEIDFAMKKLELIIREKNAEIGLEPEKATVPAIKEKETSKELPLLPYKKEEIKHRPVKVGKELKNDGLIESTDNFDRIKAKIAERKNPWAARVSLENRGGLA